MTKTAKNLNLEDNHLDEIKRLKSLIKKQENEIDDLKSSIKSFNKKGELFAERKIKDELFISLGEKLSSARTKKDAANIIVNVADKLIGWDAAVLDIYSPQLNKTFNVLKIDTVDGERREFTSNPSGDRISPRALEVIERGGQLILRKDLRQIDHDLHAFGNKARPSASIIIVPIGKKTKIKGILSIQSYKHNAYTIDDLDLLQGLANNCAGALERIQIEEELRLSEEKYRTVAETATDGILTVDSENKIMFCNPAVEKIFGYKSKELAGSLLETIIPENVWEDFQKQIIKNLKAGKIKTRTVEVEGRNKKKEKVPLEISFGVFNEKNKFNYSLIIRDITDRKSDQEKIKSSLKEKEVLLKEIHHRVKNNLQIISSLLNLQSASLSDPKGRDILRESRNRVMAMAMIHEKLYQDKDLSKLSFDNYLKQLIDFLVSAYKNDGNKITVKYNVESIHLSLDISISLGLIVNELVSNSLKHAFKLKKNGLLEVTLARSKKEIILEIKDDGNGFPPEIDFKNTESLGMQLVSNLVKQHEGKIKLIEIDGCCFEIKIPVK